MDGRSITWGTAATLAIVVGLSLPAPVLAELQDSHAVEVDATQEANGLMV